jgi:WD40 repeat protein
VHSFDFSPDGNRVASGSGKSLVRIWDIEAGAEVSSFVELC